MRTLGYLLLGMLFGQLWYQQLVPQNTAIPTFSTQQQVFTLSRRNDVCKVYGPLLETVAAACKKQAEQIQQLWSIGRLVFPPLIFLSLLYLMVRFLALGPLNYKDPKVLKELEKMRANRSEPPV